MSSVAIQPRVRVRTSTATRRELYFLHGLRLMQALTYAALAFTPTQLHFMTLDQPMLARTLALAYLVFALVMLARTRWWFSHVTSAVTLGLAVDVVVAVLASAAIHHASIGISMLLVVDIGAGALMLPLRLALTFAGLATAGIAIVTLLVPGLDHGVAAGTLPGTSGWLDALLAAIGRNGDIGGSGLQAGLFGIAYFATASFCFLLGQQLRAAEALAERRGLDVANLSQVNELIIRRMRTGVLLVDNANHVHQFNEAAWVLLGSPPHDHRDLGSLAPELSHRLYRWRHRHELNENPVSLAEGVAEVVPRFTRLSADDDANVLVFLDDTSMVSRRAEQLTLTSLGRLSASIAHEIRNPLAAIRYSAQLLAESETLVPADAHLVEIINNHCGRMNDIIENILQLSRRERSRPETLDLNTWALRFVDDYLESNDLGHDSLRAIVQPQIVAAVADPQHLYQVVWNLVQNALRYGRLPGQAARVMVIVRRASEPGPPLVEVVDRGPGIPPKVAAQIFEPFYTTHEFGTGLGLYLARQMCEANQGNLEYVPVAGGGSCFRITLTPPARVPAEA